MAGIYLKGIDMPEGLAERGFVIRGDGRVRTFVGTVYDDALAYRVPDHGRLIDADALTQNAYMLNEHYTYRRVYSADDVESAPTIIPTDHFRDAAKMMSKEGTE